MFVFGGCIPESSPSFFSSPSLGFGFSRGPRGENVQGGNNAQVTDIADLRKTPRLHFGAMWALISWICLKNGIAQSISDLNSFVWNALRIFHMKIMISFKFSFRKVFFWLNKLLSNKTNAKHLSWWISIPRYPVFCMNEIFIPTKLVGFGGKFIGKHTILWLGRVFCFDCLRNLSWD